jgi:hypothetical protein
MIAPRARRFASRVASFALLAIALAPAAASAGLSEVRVLERRAFAQGATFGDAGAYEVLRGRLFYAIDPQSPQNAMVVDLARAPRDPSGNVIVSADFLMLRPQDPAKGSGRLVYEVTNRGNLGILSTLNDARPTNDPQTAADAGNGFLLRRGEAILWSGWNWDVEANRGQLTITLPVATESGRPITGKVVHEIVPAEAGESVRISPGTIGYPLADGAAAAATLTVRETPEAARRPIPREAWRLDANEADVPKTLALAGGFTPGLLYELVYEARDPVIVGLGLVAIRDLLDAVENGAPAAAPLGRYDDLTIFGNSQSARVVNTMLALGLATGADGTAVFDAAFLLAGGAGKGGFNHRFAQTTRHFSQFEELIYPTDAPPFDIGAMLPPGEGPKIIVAGGSTDYWTRAMSLLSTDEAAQADRPLDARLRLFLLAGGPHGAGQAGARGTGLAACNNPLDFRPALRALYTALDAWAFAGLAPPPSRYPRLDDETLIDFETYRRRFPAIAGMPAPPGLLTPPVLDFGPRFEGEGIAEIVPPRRTGGLPTRVPAPDSDGNDRAGLRLPAVAVPLGTYTGWNPRDAASGLAGKAIGRWAGAFVPFASHAASRAADDPRPAIAARYGDRSAYESRYRAAAAGLVGDRLLLAEDVEPMTAAALALYDRLTERDPTADAACGFLAAQ